jgi:hypothetical protein
VHTAWKWRAVQEIGETKIVSQQTVPGMRDPFVLDVLSMLIERSWQKG